MNIDTIIRNGQRFLRNNSPSILTGIGVTGVVSTAVLAARGAFKASDLIRGADEACAPLRNVIDSPRERFIDNAKMTWKCYVPAASAGAVTVVAIVGANHFNAQRTAAAITAYSLTETAFSEYRDQVVKVVGAKKENEVREAVAQAKVDRTAPPAGTVIIGSGEVLCLEQHTGRFFMSSMEKIRRGENEINGMINHQLYVNLDEFYDLVGLQHTASSNRMGWDSETGLVDFRFDSVLTPEGVPCLAFDYSYLKPI